MPLRLRQAIGILAIILVSLLVTTTSAALALRLPAFERLNTETGSRLDADYSADPRGLRLSPLSLDLIQAAASDETALDAAPEGAPVRVPIAGAPTIEPPALFSNTPTRTAAPTETPAPAGRPAETARALDTATSTPPIPTATSTATSTSSPTATLTATNTATRTSTPTSSPTVATATGTPEDATATPAAATRTPEPPATETPVPPATATPEPRATDTPEPRATETATARATETATARATDTSTPPATDTATPPPATPTATASPTKTPSLTPTNTATKTPTHTPAPVLGKIYVDPPDQTVPPGAAAVDIVIEDAVDLGGYLVAVTWDSSILSLVEVSNGAFLGSTGRSVVCAAPAVDSTSVTFTCSSTGLASGPDGTGVLATLQFETVGEGKSPVGIIDAKVSTTDLVLYDVEATDGSVSVESPAPTETPTPTATSTPTVSPTPVNPWGNIIVSPQTQTTSSGNVDVDIRITGAQDLAGVSFDLSWDDSILVFNSDTIGPFLSSTGRIVLCSMSNVTSSSFTYDCNSTGPFSGPNGSGLLVSFRFDRAGLGTTAMTLSNGVVDDTLGGSHLANTNGGLVTME